MNNIIPIFLCLVNCAYSQRTINIKGVVKNEKNEAISYCVLKINHIGCSTNEDGVFELNIPERGTPRHHQQQPANEILATRTAIPVRVGAMRRASICGLIS